MLWNGRKEKEGEKLWERPLCFPRRKKDFKFPVICSDTKVTFVLALENSICCAQLCLPSEPVTLLLSLCSPKRASPQLPCARGSLFRQGATALPVPAISGSISSPGAPPRAPRSGRGRGAAFPWDWGWDARAGTPEPALLLRCVPGIQPWDSGSCARPRQGVQGLIPLQPKPAPWGLCGSPEPG